MALAGMYYLVVMSFDNAFSSGGQKFSKLVLERDGNEPKFFDSVAAGPVAASANSGGKSSSAVTPGYQKFQTVEDKSTSELPDVKMDPSDPKSWREDFDASSYDPGPIMDPNDSSTWQDDFDSTLVDPGPYLNPNDPSSWRDAATEPNSNPGVYLDASSPDSWNAEFDRTNVSPGPRLDPNDPSSWQE